MTKVSWWYGGLSPRQPCQSSFSHGPRIGPNMLRPMIVAPIPASPARMKSSSTPFMDELRESHLGVPRPDRPTATDRLAQAYATALAEA
ncbi:hypothetical protein [Nocardia vulneris]|uniref:hypothetical protein n=1 Tax=Nocardia vulneris TaxID=1141657 RepID=UPI003BAF9F04